MGCANLNKVFSRPPQGCEVEFGVVSELTPTTADCLWLSHECDPACAGVDYSESQRQGFSAKGYRRFWIARPVTNLIEANKYFSWCCRFVSESRVNEEGKDQRRDQKLK